MDIKAPSFPESISEGTIAEWHKAPGETAKRDELLVDIETDKVVMEVVAQADGRISEILKQAGEVVESDEVIGRFEAGEVPDLAAAASDQADEPSAKDDDDIVASPSARKLADEQGIDLAAVTGSGKNGRITKLDVAAVIDARSGSAPPAAGADTELTADVAPVPGERVERRVPMTRLRASIAKRLVEAQQNAAMLTTFNEVDMGPIMAMRKQYQAEFQAAHNGTKLGFMSFFVRACVEALKKFPAVNASIDGNDIVYHGYYDVGVAVSTERGLVVPVVRDADALSLAQIEDKIGEYGEKARSGKLAIEDMTGGTFTVSNGGIFGSLLSTPILNPPQTAILGMHKIQERPMAENGQVVIRPMMYLALSYDHRLIDGKEAVQFLIAIKSLLEDPARILLEI